MQVAAIIYQPRSGRAAKHARSCVKVYARL